MSFSPNVPNTGQSLGETKNPIRNNFLTLRNTIAENHYDVNDPKAGKHGTMIMPTVGNVDFPNPPTTLALEGALYTKESPASSGQAQLYYRRESDGIETGIAFLSGSAIGAAAGSLNLYDFSGKPDCYGIFETRINSDLGKARVIQMIYVVNGRYSTGYLSDDSTPGQPVLNFGTATGYKVSFLGSNIRVVLGAGITFPATVSWTFSGNYFSA